MKTFFIHHNPHRPGKLPSKFSRGFTAAITKGDDPTSSNNVTIQVAFCAAGDEFNKKIGRATALAKEAVPIAPKRIPHELQELSKFCNHWELPDFNYVLRNFV